MNKPQEILIIEAVELGDNCTVGDINTTYNPKGTYTIK